jgi:hypothetical protein
VNVPVLNYVLRHEWNGGIAPCILNLGTRWRLVVSFMTRPLYSRENVPGTHWIGGLVGPRAGVDAVAKRQKYPLPAPARESNSGRLVCSLLFILTELPGLSARIINELGQTVFSCKLEGTGPYVLASYSGSSEFGSRHVRRLYGLMYREIINDIYIFENLFQKEYTIHNNGICRA